MNITTSVKHRSSPESGDMITSFINAHPQGALTTITKEGTLQSSVINVYEATDTIYSFMTKKATRKYINIQKNPIVSFITYDPFSRTEAEIEGMAYEIVNSKEVDMVLKKIRQDAKLGRWHVSPFVNESDDYVLFTIYPHKLHMTTYWERSSGIEAYHEYMEFDLKVAP